MNQKPPAALLLLAIATGIPQIAFCQSFAGTWTGVINVDRGTSRCTLVVSSDEKQITETYPNDSSMSVKYRCHREGNSLRISGVDQFGQKAVGTLEFSRGYNAVVLNQRVSVLFVGVRYSGTLTREGATQQSITADTANQRSGQMTAADYYNRAVREETSGDTAGAIADYNRAIELAAGHGPNNFQGEHFPETRTRVLSAQEVQSWPEAKVRYAINEIFARHGATFTDPKITQQFSKFSWYHPNSRLSLDQIEGSLPDIEKQNVKLLGDARNAKRSIPQVRR